MKKLLFTILALGMCAGVYAQPRTYSTYTDASTNYGQRGSMAVGASLVYGSEIESIGIGLRYDYMISNAFRLQPNATIFFKNDDLSSWDINLDLQYMIPLAANWRMYPIAGLTLSHWKYDGDSSLDIDDYDETNFGVNLGIGVEYNITPRWLVNLDVKYRIISDYDQAIVGLGFAYRF